MYIDVSLFFDFILFSVLGNIEAGKERAPVTCLYL